MAMESVLKQLESRIEELITAHREAVTERAELEDTVSELEAKVAKLEGKLASESHASDRISQLEKQRDELGTRLEKVLDLVDAALETAAEDG